MARREIFICDRCGKEYIVKKPVIGNITIDTVIRVYDEESPWRSLKYELCPPCMEKHRSFMYMENEE